MARDLILINPDKAMMTLRQLSSILMKDVICCDENDAIEPVLYFFKKGLSHMSIVTRTVIGKHGLDPTKQVVGIVTMEDIIEELIQEEIEDEADAHEENKNRNVLREKLVVFYTDSRAEKILSETEYRSVLHFLQNYVKPF